MSRHKNRVKMTVTGTPGTGTITLNAASSGFQSFATAYGANATVDILITEGTAWEVARDCTYTHSGTTVTRGTLEASSTGGAVSFTAAAEVSVVMTAALGDKLERLLFDGFSAYGDNSTTVTLTNGGTTLVSTAAKTELYDANGDFDPSTGIYFPSKAGLYLIGGTAIATSPSTNSTIAVYIEYSPNGSTWTDLTRRAILWRGVNNATAANTLGGSGSYIVNADGTNDRFRLTVFYSGTGTVVVPGSASNRDWVRFWAKYLGETS